MEVAEAWARAGARVTVITARDAPAGWSREGAVDMYNVYRLPRHIISGYTGKRILSLLLVLLASIRFMRARNHDLIHAAMWHLAVLPLALGLGARTVVTVYGREVFVIPRWLNLALRRTLPRVRAVIFLSRSIQERLRQAVRHPLPHAGIAWCGISWPAQAAAHQPTGDFSRLFCLCRLTGRKNVKGAIQAVGRLRASGHDVHLFIAGDGPERASLAAECARLGLEQHVTLLGYISDEDVRRYYRDCGIFLHPQIAIAGGNDIEGFGISIADAMSFGCIPVAGVAGGPADFIQHGQTGHLVDGRDLDAIVSAVRNIRANPQQSRAMALAAQQFALRHFSWDAHVQRILASVNQGKQP